MSKELIDKETVAKKSYPFTKEFKNEDFSHDVKEGEVVRVLEYKDGVFTLLNVSLGISQAWFKLTDEEYKMIVGN